MGAERHEGRRFARTGAGRATATCVRRDRDRSTPQDRSSSPAPDTGAQQGLLEYRAGQIPLGRVRAIQPFLRKLSPVFLVATCGGGGEWSEERSRSGEFELTCRVDGMGG
jgi:hypothetical protein